MEQRTLRRIDHPDAGFMVATKMGRRAEQVLSNYVEANFRAWIDRSRTNLGTDRLDLVQLHCPPSEVIDDDRTYDVLDRLVEEGLIAAYGVSVETTAQALSAIGRPHVASVQIILNAFRMKPLDSTRRSPPTTTGPTTETAAPSTWGSPPCYRVPATSRRLGRMLRLVSLPSCRTRSSRASLICTTVGSAPRCTGAGRA